MPFLALVSSGEGNRHRTKGRRDSHRAEWIERLLWRRRRRRLQLEVIREGGACLDLKLTLDHGMTTCSDSWTSKQAMGDEPRLIFADSSDLSITASPTLGSPRGKVCATYLLYDIVILFCSLVA